MERIAVFPGSFDPFTLGHESIVNRSLSLFDKIYIVVGYNSKKEGYFTVEKRMEWINKVYKNNNRIIVDSYSGLTVDFCKRVHAKYILRGLRTSSDFEYERTIAQLNRAMAVEIESVFLLTTPELTPINSTIVREIIRHGGDAQKFVPAQIDLSDV
ncbi:MAG TPA: pantetheine-phosphate adenylyltransferase [Bacteroidales bacterium]|nr:MAG: pantetheine-phosphate adenylyltransferase [Bacteroidetes bacterium GWF2_33_38]OFY73726.1 MAG: pantetheine-phosphate adenylyltransferase [Bacteroidetes bacterium RIFOXYA12_FULL_33_9]HBF89183.1 pantetheine-phosphate adenylyltransferase [Bacteroidales bacterium]